MTPTQTPGDVLKRLLEGADKRRARSLQLIHAVCEELRAHGSRDYRLTTIGRLLKEKNEGGPSTAALGNGGSSVAYRTLIHAHRDAQGVQTQRRKMGRGEELLDGVRDPLQRDRIRDLCDEVRRLRGRLKALQHLANNAAAVDLVPGANGTMVATMRAVNATPFDLRPYEREALLRALDPRRLKHARLVETPEGRVETEDGEECLPLGFATGLRKAMASLGLGEKASTFDGFAVDGPIKPNR